MKYGCNIDLGKNALKNAAIDPRDGAPGAAADFPIGQIYTDIHDTTSHVFINLATGGTNAWTQLASGTAAMFNPMTAVGDMIVGDTAGASVRLAGTQSTTRHFLRQVGSGSASALPVWDTFQASDIPSLPASIITSGQLPVAYGGTAKASWTQYGLVYNDTTTSFSDIVEITTAGKALVSTVAGAPVFGKMILTQPTTAATITFTTDSTTLTVANTASVSGTNTGDVTLATDSGLALTSGQTGLYIGTPSSITPSSSNAVTTNTHTHAISGFVLTGGGSHLTAGTTTVDSTATLAIAAGASFTVASGATFTSDKLAVNDTDIPNKAYVDNRVPTGTILEYAGFSAPNGFLLCLGQSVLRSTFADLFAIIGTTYGHVDGTHFNIPNKQGKVSVGANLTSYQLGTTGGEATHTLTLIEMPPHAHSYFHVQYNAGSGGSSPLCSTQGYADITSSEGSGGAHNNMQPFIAMNFMIKT